MIAESDRLPNYLTAEQILLLGGDPEELRRHRVEPATGHDGRPCWPRDQVQEWLGRRQ
jgi:hypothetical protein